jgi:hypothetical protein
MDSLKRLAHVLLLAKVAAIAEGFVMAVKN